MAKYSDGRKYRRRLGQRRKCFNLNDNLGSFWSSNLKGKEVQFIGDKGDEYFLTKHQRYKIIDTDNTKYNFDKDIEKRFGDLSYHKSRKVYNSCQEHGATITIINDKGHKRKYYHEMFRLVDKL